MTAWRALLKKEFYLGRTAFIIAFIALWVIIGAAAYIEFGRGNSGILIAVSAILIFPHTYYLLGYTIVSLRAESKRLNLWLHNPLPGYALLSAKLLNGLLAMTVSLLITFVILYWKVFDKVNELITGDVLLKGSIFILTHLYLFAIYTSIWFIFYWTIFRYLKSRIGGYSWLVIIVTYFAISTLFEKFRGSTIYENLTGWGEVEIVFLNDTLTSAFTGEIPNLVSSPSLYIGVYVFYAATSLILFFISSWMIDRKIEVE